jgi:hypothetical protein
MYMKTTRDTADLDAYDQGRIDTNERFMKALEEGYRQARTKEELFNYIIKQMDPTNTGTEGTESEQI